MFVDPKDKGKTPLDAWFDNWARKHPLLFGAVLVLLTAGVTVGLLAQPGYTLVLYQGF
ncbi:MAG: hypothetical protein ABL956_05270 [Hyphomonadaceae bacterium]